MLGLTSWKRRAKRSAEERLLAGYERTQPDRWDQKVLDQKVGLDLARETVWLDDHRKLLADSRRRINSTFDPAKGLVPSPGEDDVGDLHVGDTFVQASWWPAVAAAAIVAAAVTLPALWREPAAGAPGADAYGSPTIKPANSEIVIRYRMDPATGKLIFDAEPLP